MPTVAELIVEGLVRAEVPRLFGVPGGGSNLEVLEAARARGLPFVLCHQEWAACIMAALSSGGPQGYKDEAYQNPRRSVRKLAQGCCPNYRALVDSSAKPRHGEASPSQVGYPQVMARRREIVRATPHDQRDHSFVTAWFHSVPCH